MGKIVYQNENNINNEIWTTLKNIIVKFIEDQNFSDLDIANADKDIRKIMKSFKKRTNISLKDEFGSKYYSDPEWLTNQVVLLVNKIDEKTAKYKDIYPLIINLMNFPERIIDEGENFKADNSILYSFLLNKFPWAADSINDFISLKSLANLNSFLGTDNVLLGKMIFKESFSLIDRLRQEFSIELSKSINRDLEELSLIENKNIVKNLYKYYPQDSILNNNLLLFSRVMPYFTHFEYDDEGWVTFSFDDLENFISPGTNNFYRLLKITRNNFEHSLPTNFRQLYIAQKVIREDDDNKTSESKIIDYWKAQYFYSTIVFIYHLLKMDDKMK